MKISVQNGHTYRKTLRPVHLVQISNDELYTAAPNVHDQLFIRPKLHGLLNAPMDVMRFLIAINQGDVQTSCFLYSLNKCWSIAGCTHRCGANGPGLVYPMLKQNLGVFLDTGQAALKGFRANGINAIRSQFDELAAAE